MNQHIHNKMYYHCHISIILVYKNHDNLNIDWSFHHKLFKKQNNISLIFKKMKNLSFLSNFLSKIYLSIQFLLYKKLLSSYLNSQMDLLYISLLYYQRYNFLYKKGRINYYTQNKIHYIIKHMIYIYYYSRLQNIH